jgi:hypothetical protein
MVVVSFTPLLLFPQGNFSSYPSPRWVLDPMWVLWRKQKYLPLPENSIQIVRTSGP